MPKHAVASAFGLTPFGGHIAHVVGLIADEEMVRVHAQSIVATVQNMFSI